MSVKTGLGLAGEGPNEDRGGPQRAGLAIDGALRVAGIAPYLRRDKSNDQAKEEPHRRQHPRGDPLERVAALPDGDP
jgi:hypothetical protein